MPRVFDNIALQLLPALRETIQVAYRADFCVGYFNLRGWKVVSDLVERWEGTEESRVRLIVGMQRLPADELKAANRLIKRDETMDNASAIRLRKRLAEEFREQLTIGLPTNQDEKVLQTLAAQLRAGKVVVKLHLRHTLHAKLYLNFRHDPINPVVGYLGSSNFTLSGLEKGGELNIDVLDGDACTKLSKWFGDRWEDKWSLDISNELAEIIETSWVRRVSPFHIYLKIAYHLAREARAGQAEFDIPQDFGAQLFDFQTAAVKIAAHHVNTRGGVVLGDVVGLGKTMMACALASIFQHPPYFLETLVMCPPNLKSMWEEALARHRIIGKVVKLSESHKLASERRYRLLIIDESHNLRSGEGKRYGHILDYIQKNEPKVVMLSATPYNKHYGDLLHQLRLFVPLDKALGVRPERMLADLSVAEFMARHQAAPDTLAAFGHSTHADDWRELMRLYLVRRTRTFIQNNYAHADPDGRKYLLFSDGTPFYFPARVPVTVPFPLDESDKDDQYGQLYSRKVVETINALNLPRYGLGNYLKTDFKTPISALESETVGNLSRAGKRLMGFCRTNLFKRLESSGSAFLQSIERHVLRNCVFLHALNHKLPLPIGTQDVALLDAAFNDEDEIIDLQAGAASIYAFYAKNKKSNFHWLRSELFQPALKKALEADNRALQDVLDMVGKWKSSADTKLALLHDLVCHTHPDEKVLVFSQFADTVRYLESELKKRGVTQLQGVSGADLDPTSLAGRFSPKSNAKTLAPGDELRVLLATDVLSEGQNLQDAHIVINYDLPWAIIRLIQRAGRVDRIGQTAPEIRCYSFLPADGVEKLITLRGRLKNRLSENAEVIGTDERFFEDETEHQLRDLYNEKAGIMDEEDDGEVDLASHAFQIWKNATDADPTLRKTIPALGDVVAGAKAHVGPAGQSGAIVYVRTPGDTDALALVNGSGHILTQSQWQILKVAACDANEPALEIADNHHQLVAQGVDGAFETEKAVGGSLGKPSGARYKAYHVLKRYHEAVKGSLFDLPEISNLTDALFRSPLKQTAADSINAQFKIGASDEHLVQLLLCLHEEDRLVQNEGESEEDAEPRLICSLGLNVPLN